MKKRLTALFLALRLSLSLAACGKQEAPETPPEEPEAVEPLPEETPEETPEEETPEEETPEEETEEPAEELQQETENSAAEKPAESKPAQTPVQKPAEEPAQEQSKPAASVDLAAFFQTVAADCENVPAMMQVEGETLDAFYAGLSDIKTNQCGVYMAMISAAVGEIALVEVQNADDVQKVKDIFQARIDYQVGDETNPGGAWYPDTIEGWKNHSRIVSNGNYVMMVALDKADDVAAAFNALFV